MMDLVECEAHSFTRQEIIHQLIFGTHRQGRSMLAQSVIDSLVGHFDQLALVENVCFCLLVLWLAFMVFYSQR